MSEAPDRSIRMRNAVIVVAVVGVVAVLLWFWGPWPGDGGDTRQPPEVATTEEGEPSAAVPEEPTPDEITPSDAERAWTSAMGTAPEWKQDVMTAADCEEVREELARLCAALDARVPDLRLQGGACGLLEPLSGALVADPPDISSELSSYTTVLENVFHVFRVAGRERMGLLRQALGEQELAEPAAFVLYRWASSRERCDGTATPGGWGNALYAYSGFLFNTMGGQAYLRRRSPKVEGLACFYGLQLLDRAIRGGHNPGGLDPRAEIPRCRELVASQSLVFSERYVASLEEMARRWKNRGARER